MLIKLNLSSVFSFPFKELLGNTSDLDHFDSIHSMAGIVSPEEVLRKGKFYYFMHKILHFDYQVLWENGKDENKNLAYNKAIITPILFGYPLTIFTMLLQSTLCPPVYYMTTTLIKFNICFYLVTAFTPVSPLRSHCVHNIYYAPGFWPRLFTRIAFNSLLKSVSLCKQAVIKMGGVKTTLLIIYANFL